MHSLIFQVKAPWLNRINCVKIRLKICKP